MDTLYAKLEKALKTDPRFVDSDGSLFKHEVIDKAYKADHGLIEILIADKELEAKFFSKIKNHSVFNINDFVAYIQDKDFLNDSYTKFKNKIGLNIDGKFLNERKEVALVWPFKDCVLEGGMTKEDEKKKEIFFNEILAQDEIDKLFAPKVLTNWKRYTKNGEEAVKELKRDSDGTIRENLIIKGNNLLALHTLKTQFQRKIKLIYIDPPYNTENDSFAYNDSFTQSTWLTFMKNRLEIAKDLLQDDGAIFVQCDYNQDAYLRVLMDEIKGFNFVANIAVKSSTPSGTKTAHKDKKIIKQKDTILLYKKESLTLVPQYTAREDWDVHYNLFLKKKKSGYYFEKLLDILKENGFKYEKLDEINPTNEAIRKFIIENSENIIRLQSHKNIDLDKLSRVKYKDIIYEHVENGIVKDLYYNGQVLTPIKQGIKKVLFGKEEKEYWSVLVCDFWSDIDFQNTQNEGGVSLTNGKKPEALIKRIIDMTTNPGDIILDYHLGSGTTSAVAHKMQRQYIGIEQLDGQIEKSTERLTNVINGENSGISKAITWKGGGNFVYCELMKYNENFVNQIEKAKDTKALLKIWNEMKEKAFFKYSIDLQEFEKSLKEFEKFDLDKQKNILVSLLNKNQMYVNLSEIEDKDFRVGKSDREMNKEFYG